MMLEAGKQLKGKKQALLFRDYLRIGIMYCPQIMGGFGSFGGRKAPAKTSKYVSPKGAIYKG